MARVISLWMIAAILCCSTACRHLPSPPADERDPIDLVRGFSCYNCRIGAIGWEALGDSENVGILEACLRGAAEEDLAGLGFSDLSGRLKKLEEGRLIQRTGGLYRLAYPAIHGRQREELASQIERAASQLYPSTAGMVQEIRPLLQGRDEMLYHVVWSGAMDGPFAWQAIERKLAELRGTGDVDLRTAWWLWPSHPFRAGTNTYGGLAITSWDGYPEPDTLREEMRPALEELKAASLAGRPVSLPDGRSRLLDRGLIDAAGRSRLFVVTADSPLVSAIPRLSGAFAASAMSALDAPSLARSFGASLEQAAVIAYHELCYELLEMLSAGGEIDIPDAKASEGRDTYRLVSCFASE